MEMVTAEIKRFARKHEERLHHHDNVEAIQLLNNTELLRRLKRTKPFELAYEHMILEEYRQQGSLKRKHPNSTG
jgi:hypothetical protein